MWPVLHLRITGVVDSSWPRCLPTQSSDTVIQRNGLHAMRNNVCLVITSTLLNLARAGLLFQSILAAG